MKTDTRFYAGYTWVSDNADCRTGLAMPTTNAAEAARMFFSNDASYYFNRGKTRVAYTLKSAEADAVRHEITL